LQPQPDSGQLFGSLDPFLEPEVRMLLLRNLVWDLYQKATLGSRARVGVRVGRGCQNRTELVVDAPIAEQDVDELGVIHDEDFLAHERDTPGGFLRVYLNIP
jgi:hypothetical protein